MWTAPEGRKFAILGKRALRAGAILLVLLSGAAGPSAAAPAPQSATSAPASAEDRAELRRTLESRYEVLPVSGGVVLKPKKALAGIRSIELTGAQVAVNGERVSARTLRDWLGEDADAVLRLQGLPAAEQRRVFGLDNSGVPEATEVTAAPLAPEPPAAPSGEVTEVPVESVTSDATVSEDSSDATVAEEPAEEEKADTSGRHNSGSRVNVGGSVQVDEDEIAEEAIAVGGSATVNGEVSRDVVAIGGPAHIKGRVGGEVVAVGGGVYLGPNAVVEGNVTAVGGRIHREPGSRIEGNPSEVSFLPRDLDFHWGPNRFWSGFSDFMGSLTWLVLMGLMVCLVLLVARVPLERVDRMLTAQPWPSALTGLLSAVFFWPLFIVVTILLAVTIVGCALFLLYPFLFLYLILLGFLGYAAVCYRIGRWLENRFHRNFGGPYAVALVGVFILQIWTVISSLFHMVPWMGFFAFMFGLFGFILQATAWVVGFGAVVLARFGTSPGYWPSRGAPPVPPPPPVYEQNPYAEPVEPVEPLPYAEPPVEPRWEEPRDYPPPPDGESR